MNQELGRRGQTKGKAAKLVKAKPQRQNCTAMVQQQISQLTLIIDNLIYQVPLTGIEKNECFTQEYTCTRETLGRPKIQSSHCKGSGSLIGSLSSVFSNC